MVWRRGYWGWRRSGLRGVVFLIGSEAVSRINPEEVGRFSHALPVLLDGSGRELRAFSPHELSRDGFAYRLKLHVATAAQTVPTLSSKRITPHILRHSIAMSILRATGDIRKVSLWLGHTNLQTTAIYLRASPDEKLEILSAGQPPTITKGAFPGATDSLLNLLKRA